ncbi:cache domain-containing protein, partial [Campylobacter sp. MOP51]|uniref:cache domain-containing protein n=1 Tax=Campylobacter canis TaxID=3378588 RepID=UPI003C396D25
MKKAANKIALIIFVLLTIAFAIFETVSYKGMKDTIIDVSKSSKEASTRSVAIYVREYFNSKIVAVENLAKYIQDNPYLMQDRQSLKDRLMTMATTLNIAEFYIGFGDNGDLFDAVRKSNEKIEFLHLTPEKDNFDSRTKPWYKQSVAKGDLVFTHPYLAQSSGKYTLTIVKPIIIDGKAVGVVAADMYLDDIAKDVAQMKESQSSSVAIVDIDAKLLVYHPNNNFILSDEPGLKTAINLAIDSYATTQGKAYIHTLGGDERLFACQKYDKANWLICSDNSLSDYDPVLNEIIYHETIFSTVFVMGIIGALIFVVGYFLKPLNLISTGLISFFKFLNHEIKEP